MGENSLCKPPVVVFNLGRGGVPQGRSVAGQISGTPLFAGLNHLTLSVPVLSSRGPSSSPSPALQLGPQPGPQGSLWQALDRYFQVSQKRWC